MDKKVAAAVVAAVSLGTKALSSWYDVPHIKRKEYARIARIGRNELKHAQMFPKKEKVSAP